MRSFFLSFVLVLLLSSNAFSDVFKSYKPTSAASYATNNVYITYGDSSGKNPFFNYESAGANNCTNFVNQAILGGLIGSNSAKTVWDSRKNFIATKGNTRAREWYFIHEKDRGDAFIDVNTLYKYAKENKAGYKGLHFDYVTHDTKYSYMEYKKVKVGDIVFADWENDDRFDHAMIVTRISRWGWKYNKIRLTYQSVNKTDVGLGDLNNQKAVNGYYRAVFHVYRPTYYTPFGN